MTISPENRDPLDMHIWYSKIGDEYALWMLERIKQLEQTESDAAVLFENHKKMIDCTVELLDDKIHEVERYIKEKETISKTTLLDWLQGLRKALKK